MVSNFKGVLKGMKDSREYFENLPDTGFFGKTFSRWWNLAEVYLFRFIFVGIIIILILMPIAIVINVVLSISLALTSWLWIPIYLISRYIFGILIYDVDGVRREDSVSKFVPNFKVPLISEIVRFFFMVCYLNLSV